MMVRLPSRLPVTSSRCGTQVRVDHVAVRRRAHHFPTKPSSSHASHAYFEPEGSEAAESHAFRTQPPVESTNTKLLAWMHTQRQAHLNSCLRWKQAMPISKTFLVMGLDLALVKPQW